MTPRRHKEVGGHYKVDVVQLLVFFAKDKASDLHLSVGLPPMVRTHGNMHRINVLPPAHQNMYSMVYNTMSDGQRKVYEENLEVDFSFEIPGLLRLRVNAFNQNRGASAVLRTTPSKVLSLNDLRAPAVFAGPMMELCGLVLVTGPTGSGKSTALVVMVNHCNENDMGHILMAEGPVELVYESKKNLINQCELGPRAHSFANVLKPALRGDSDMVLAGELCNLETIRLALTAAEAGHLVFGTLHISSVARTIGWVVDVFPSDEKEVVWTTPSESLEAVISQTLLKTHDGSGRIAAHEIMIVTPAICHLIRGNKISQMYSMMQTNSDTGMQTLDQCLPGPIKRSAINYADVRAIAKNLDASAN